jgi:hypothetical protein
MSSASVAAPDSTAMAESRQKVCPIDFARYPVDRLESPAGDRLIAEARAGLAETGCLLLKDFVTPDGLAALAQQTRALAPLAHGERRFTNPYSSADAPDLPASHPRRRFQERTNGFVAGDLIEPGSAARALYHHKGFQDFVARVVGVEALCEYADPLAGIVINVLKPGCTHPWHFDNNDFIVSLMTQRSEAGGAFEYCPGLRSATHENYSAVTAVLDGDRHPVHQLDLCPGDLQIFFGRNALHRVSPVEGAQQRHTLILAYSEEPGVIGDPERTRLLFGRATAAHDDAARSGTSRPAHGSKLDKESPQ